MPRTSGAINKPKFINIPLSVLVEVLNPDASIPVDREVAEAILKLRSLNAANLEPQVEVEPEEEPVGMTVHNFQ
jgi:hypothetical protein